MRRFWFWFLSLFDLGWTRGVWRRRHKRDVAERRRGHPPGWYPSVLRPRKRARRAREFWEETGIIPDWRPPRDGAQ